MVFYQQGSETEALSPKDLEKALFFCIEKTGLKEKSIGCPP